jgi:RNA polymerase sigma factor (sigma-70 family)
MSVDPVRAWLSRPESLTQLRKYVATYQAPHITADELVSACIERMLERSDIFEGEVDKVSAWARRVAWSSALNVHRTESNQLKHRAARSVEWADEAGLSGVEHSTPEDAYERDEVRALMRASMSIGPHGRRFVAVATREVSSRCVADEIGLNRDTINGRYRRWKVAVRELAESAGSVEELIDEVAVL